MSNDATVGHIKALWVAMAELVLELEKSGVTTAPSFAAKLRATADRMEQDTTRTTVNKGDADLRALRNFADLLNDPATAGDPKNWTVN